MFFNLLLRNVFPCICLNIVVKSFKYMYVGKKENTVKYRYLEVDGTSFYKFKLPEVQINLHFG